ncbi:MAG: DUF1232 domain-containing protein [Rhodobiaceae bacterium]|nr:DUF1232 domain-containing protein [Rhodobiaceae bacterium]
MDGPLDGEILTGRDLTVVESRERTVRRKFWSKFRSVVGRIPFARDLLAAYFCAMDPKTPFRVRATLLGALVYFIMPIDALPDIIAVLGYTDDAAVLFAAIRAVSGAMKAEHYDKAEAALREPASNPA